MGFYDQLYGDAQDFYQGGIDQIYRNFVNPIQQGASNLGSAIANYQMSDNPPIEPGPRFGLYGPVFRQQSAPAQMQGPQAPIGPMPQDLSMAANPYYPRGDFDPSAASTEAPPAGSAFYENPSPPPVTQIPPSGDPHKNEYEAMVKNYLQKLQTPAQFPQPKALTQMQALAVVMNPDKSQELTEQFQGLPYKRELAKFEFEQNQQGRGADIAMRLAEKQEEDQRRDAQQAWFRESAMANSGTTAIPPGYQWKNPELKAVYEQKVHEKAQADKRTEEYLNRGVRGKPRDKYLHLKNLNADIMRLQGQMMSPGVQQYQVMSQAGVADPGMGSVIQNMEQELNDKIAEKQAVSAMDDADYLQFINLDGIRQQKIIQEYLAALKSRQGLPGAKTMTAPPGGGPP